jgi:hypothetical protein
LSFSVIVGKVLHFDKESLQNRHLCLNNTSSTGAVRQHEKIAMLPEQHRETNAIFSPQSIKKRPAHKARAAFDA